MRILHRKATALLWILNLSDLAFTLLFIGKNWATEGNPLLLYFFNHSVWAFVAAKMCLSTGGVLILARFPEKDVAVLGTVFLSGIYASLFFFQVFMTVTGAR